MKRAALMTSLIFASACALTRGSEPAAQPQKSALSQCYPDHEGRRSCREPIFYIDGKRWENSISDLNPSEIETVDVFKGDLAAKQFGEDARHGVVVITTKRAVRTGTRE